ncbi:MAG: hypothetical protein IJW44_01225 [Clostridia bacterium]|nr:hypothetical protein [Clostridia bacterium]
MLKVLPVQSKLQQEELCQKCKISFNPDLLAYAATVDEEFVGLCQFKLTDKGGMLYDLAKVVDRPPCDDERARQASDFEALFVMGRGTLNFIDLCGVHYAQYLGENPDEGLLRAIGFSKNEDGIYDINLEGFFTDHCHNHKNEA